MSSRPIGNSWISPNARQPLETGMFLCRVKLNDTLCITMDMRWTSREWIPLFKLQEKYEVMSWRPNAIQNFRLSSSK